MKTYTKIKDLQAFLESLSIFDSFDVLCKFKPSNIAYNVRMKYSVGMSYVVIALQSRTIAPIFCVGTNIDSALRQFSFYSF